MVLNYKKRWFAACQDHLFFMAIGRDWEQQKKDVLQGGVHLL